MLLSGCLQAREWRSVKRRQRTGFMRLPLPQEEEEDIQNSVPPDDEDEDIEIDLTGEPSHLVEKDIAADSKAAVEIEVQIPDKISTDVESRGAIEVEIQNETGPVFEVSLASTQRRRRRSVEVRSPNEKAKRNKN